MSPARRLWSVIAVAGVAAASSGCLDSRPLDLPKGDYSTLDVQAGAVPAPAFSTPSGLAMIPVREGVATLYFTDDGHRILRMASDSGDVGVLAGAEAGFGAITDLTTDGARFLFVADGCAIRKVDTTTGEVATVLPSVSDACASGPSHLSYCSSDATLYVSDGAVLRQVDVGTGAVREVNGSDGKPWAATGGGQVGPVTCLGDTLFVADDRFLANVAMTSGVWGASITGKFSSGSPISSLVSSSAYLYLLEGKTIWRVEPSTGESIACELLRDSQDSALPSPYRCPSSLASGVSGPLAEVFLTDSCTHSMRAINCESHTETTLVPASTVPAVDGPGVEARLAWPAGVTTDDAGNAFVVDGRSIRELSAATHKVTTLARDALTGQPDLNWPVGIVSDGNRTLYVADPTEYTIQKIDVSTGEVSRLIGTIQEGTSSSRIGGLAIDRAGRQLYFTNLGDATVRGIDLSGDVPGQPTIVAGQRYSFGGEDGPPQMARFVFPSGLAFDGQRLLVADAGASTIRAIDLDQQHTVRTIAGLAGVPGTADGTDRQARFIEPISVALDIKGNLAVVDRLAGTVRRLELENGAVKKVTTILGASVAVGSPLPAPATNLGATPGQLYLPQAIAFNPWNELFLVVPNALLVAR